MSTPLIAALRRAQDGTGPGLVLPREPEGEALPLHGGPGGEERIALIAWTSGSTGEARAVALDARALDASAARTEEHLGGPGAWLLCLPVHHIAGAQVVLRAARSGAEHVTADPGPFRADHFAALCRRLSDRAAGQRRYTSLVPTQLSRVLADPSATEAARTLDAILVGGSSLHPRIAATARSEGLAVVRTYGMTETCGGVVYDGRPLPGVEVTVESDLRVRLTGPMVGAGYARLRPGPAAWHLEDVTPFAGARPGARNILTSDLGRLDDGVLTIAGRADDTIISGGENIAPLTVESAVLHHIPHASEALLTGVDDPAWGQRTVLLLAVDGGESPSIGEIRERLRPHLPAAWLPRAVHRLEHLPARGIGKPDRRAAALMAAELERSTMESRAPTEE